MDVAREDMKRVRAKEGDEVYRVKWKIFLRSDDPEYGEAERKRRYVARSRCKLNEKFAEIIS